MKDLPTGPSADGKKRPRLDLTVAPQERKRGKSMFGIVLGTLKKAKIEDKERNASEAVCLLSTWNFADSTDKGGWLGEKTTTDRAKTTD